MLAVTGLKSLDSSPEDIYAGVICSSQGCKLHLGIEKYKASLIPLFISRNGEFEIALLQRVYAALKGNVSRSSVHKKAPHAEPQRETD